MLHIKKYPPQEKIKQLFWYRGDGKLIRRVKRSNTTNIGDVVGCVNKTSGYEAVKIGKIPYLVHRIIYIYKYGYNPENDIDHIDRNKLNNRIENLREVSRSCNIRNSSNPKDNTSGVKGVTWSIRDKKWITRVGIFGKRKHIGQYEDFDEAVLYRLAAEQCLNWEGCDSSSPAYRYCITNKLIKVK